MTAAASRLARHVARHPAENVAGEIAGSPGSIVLNAQRTKDTMLTANRLEKIMELEENLRSEYQDQLDAKTKEIERLTGERISAS